MKRGGRGRLVALGLAALVALCATAFLIRRSADLVQVTVRNSTQRTIAAVRLEHEHGVELLSNLEPGETKVMRFQALGETSYKLTARFADGSEVSDAGQYAESGYQFVETVGDSGISSDVRLPSY